jgi:apolipoprotein N-acyltransferase
MDRITDVRASRTLLCALYAAIAMLALAATWHQNLMYFGANPLTGTVRFWRETLVTPASVSIMVDIFLLALAVVVWMVIEARRLGIGYVWAYVALGWLVAISVALPLFLIARERRLAALGSSPENTSLTRTDLIGLVLSALPALVLSLWSLVR